MSTHANLSVGSTSLVPLNAGFIPQLHRFELGEALAFRWRHHGVHSSPADFEASLWQCLCNFVVVSNGQPVGLVSAYDHDFANQHCKIAAAKFGAGIGGLAVITGTYLLIDYLFQGWNFRKLYVESTGYNAKQFNAGRHSILVEEGRLRDHIYLAGRLWDLEIYAIYREVWAEFGSRWIANRSRTRR